MPRLRFSRQARHDLIEIWVAVAAHDPSLADRVLDRIEGRCGMLRDHPQLGPARPDISDEARVLVIERWLALYRLTDDGVQIVRVVDGARDLTSLPWPSD